MDQPLVAQYVVASQYIVVTYINAYVRVYVFLHCSKIGAVCSRILTDSFTLFKSKHGHLQLCPLSRLYKHVSTNGSRNDMAWPTTLPIVS